MASRFPQVSSGPAWSISLSEIQIKNLLRLKTFVFHFATFFWHMLLNYQTTMCLFHIYFTRIDLVNKTFGLGIQYITIWNQIIQQTYFNACLLQDLLEFTPAHKYPRLKVYLKEKIPFAFASFVFPLSFLVFINFWVLYTVYPEIIDEDNVTATFFPVWVNHGMHTIIILLNFVEKFIIHRSYPTKLVGFAGLTLLIFSYAATCSVFYFLSGLWPYPLFKVMNNFQRLIFVVTNCFLGLIFIVCGEAINKRIWGRSKTAEESTEKKES